MWNGYNTISNSRLRLIIQLVLYPRRTGIIWHRCVFRLNYDYYRTGLGKQKTGIWMPTNFWSTKSWSLVLYSHLNVFSLFRFALIETEMQSQLPYATYWLMQQKGKNIPLLSQICSNYLFFSPDKFVLITSTCH